MARGFSTISPTVSFTKSKASSYSLVACSWRDTSSMQMVSLTQVTPFSSGARTRIGL